MSNTVYFMGAGFSKALGGPLQSEILPGILRFDEPIGNNTNRDSFSGERQIVSHFIENAFPNVEHDAWQNIPMEDLFSILDRAILNKESFRNMSFEELIKARSALVHTIIYLMDYRLQGLNEREVDLWYLIEMTLPIVPDNDRTCFITTNWDIILDNAIFNRVTNYPILDEQNNNRRQVYKLDYGFHSYYFRDERRSLLWQRRYIEQTYLFKLHGSLNWLLCPNCNRLFHEIGEKIALREFIDPQPCQFCRGQYQNQQNDNSNHPFHLQSFIIMPTMLKELRNLHLQQVWHKAGIELARADRVVFIGYSFPLADFEIRYLLSHHIKRNCEIEVVLHENDNPEFLSRQYQQFSAGWRYKSFFGNHCQIHYKGFEGCVESFRENN